MGSGNVTLTAGALACALGLAACGPSGRGTNAIADSVVLITIDTLRADRVGAYGYAQAVTPALDAIAAAGMRFTSAFATAPVTLPSHASMLSGRYPAGHGARHNGLRVSDDTPLITEQFRAAGFSTGAFVAAFPLDRRFGLARGFETYDDAMPRDARGQQLNERPGHAVVDEAIAWLTKQGNRRVFLWVHLFEPHAPYGDLSDPATAHLSVRERYDREIGEADRQIARLLNALGDRRARTLVAATADHGEAFGEHAEIGHSIFVYDTTLHVPLVMSGPGIPSGSVVADTVGLVDLAPTLLARTGVRGLDTDGRDLSTAHLEGGRDAGPGARPYYAESYAPLLDFGWSPLRTVRVGAWKYIDAPVAELYDVVADPAESRNVVRVHAARAADLAAQVDRMGGPGLAGDVPRADRDGRLAALGYIGRSPSADVSVGRRPDPKDKVEVAAAIARITSGEARGAALEPALRTVLAEDPDNPQMHVRLGFVLAESNRCAAARPHFDAAIRGGLPSADAHLGLASCQSASREFAAALATLREAERAEPGNPVVAANTGLVLLDAGRPSEAVAPLDRALAAAPDLHQARFALALAHARLGQRAEATAAAQVLLTRLPTGAPQRAEVERLLAALTSR